MNLFGTLQVLVSTTPVVGALLLLRAANVPQARRHQQFALPAVAVLFGIAALVVLYRFNDWFDRLLALLFRFLPFLEWFYETRWLYVIENTAIVVAFLALKYVYRGLSSRLFRGDRFPGSIVVEQFYEYDAESGRWYVRQRLSQVRLFYRVLFWVSLGVTVLLIVLMGVVPDWAGFAAISFPAVAVLVLGEIWYALDGVTRLEARSRLVGERDAAQRIANYAALRKIFQETFPDRVIDEGIDLSNPYSLSSHAALEELAKSDEALERLFSEFFARAKRGGLDADENLIHAALRLLRGTSVLINTPFYSDLTTYLALPAYIRLLRGGKCLIVTGRDSAAQELVEWMAGGLESLTGVPELWRVQILAEEEDEGLDVGILRAADLHNARLLAENDAFFREVETVLIVEPSRILTTGQLGLGVVVSRLARGEAPVYAAFDRNHDGLVDALSHLLKVNLTDVVATRQGRGASSEMVWRAEGPHLAARILPGISRDLGVGTEIAAVAMKYHVDEIEWVGGEKFPVTDMAWIAGQYFGRITAFAEMEASQRELHTALRARSNPLAIAHAERHFLVVEDELSNVYETLRLFGSRSTESGFLNLISEEYLLRDYMVDNRELFATDPKAIPSIVPDYARTARNTVLRLVMELSTFAIPESVLLRELELVGEAPDDADRAADPFDAPVVALLRRLVERYLNVSWLELERSGGQRLAGTVEMSGAEPEGSAESSYRLLPGSGLDAVVRGLRSAYFLVEDEAEGRDFIGACLGGHVPQTVLPGQFLTVAGKYYQVQTIGSAEHRDEVVLRRAAEHISGRPAYRPLRSFRILDRRAPEQSAPLVEGERITLERQVVVMEAVSHGYLDLPHRAAFTAAKRVAVAGLEPRVYIEKDALRIAVPGAGAEVRRTIAVLLNELFVSVFPAGHAFVVAVTPDRDRDFGDLLPGFEVDDEEAIYILEDSSVDLGLIIAVERNWRRLFETVTDYLAWLHEPRVEPEEEGGGTAVFPGETPEEVAERERRIAEAEAAGAYPVPKRTSWWRRLLGRVRGWFRREEKGKPEDPVPAEGKTGAAASEGDAGAAASEGEEPGRAVSVPSLEVSFDVPAPDPASESGTESDQGTEGEDDEAK